MGIADESKNNPLKVLHSELDKNINSNDEDKKISFIGISNWSLDASKMNRAINIVIEDPDINFINQTAKDIASSCDIVIAAKSEKLINAISKAYIYYINDYQPNQGKEDFHGLRDFYYLIKYVFNSLHEIYFEKNENFNIDNHLNIILQGIIKNFGGQEKSIYIIKNKFNEYYFDKNDKIEIPINYNVVDCINENLNNKSDYRYLLLIGNNDINEYILKCLLINKKYVILSDKDLKKCNNDALNLLLKIQFFMEKEIILILKNLEILYPSLYDLFNKNFTHYGTDKKFAKISYENKQNLTYVNDNFHIIILVEEKNLDNEDKPFLNRFEKHLLSINNLLNEKLLKIAEDCYNSILNLIKLKENDKVINLKTHLINIRFEKIKLCIYKLNRDNIFSIEKLLSKIVPLFSQELIYLLNYNDFIIDNISYKSIIKNIYKEKYKKNYNFNNYLLNLQQDSFINLIYTFSKKKTKLFNENDIINDKFSSRKTFIYDLDEILKEQDFIDKIKSDKYNLIIIKYKEDEINKIGNIINIKKIIDNYIKSQNKDKQFIFIIYKNKVISNIKSDNINDEISDLFSIDNSIFIDNLDFQNENNNIEILIENLNEYSIINDNDSMKELIDEVFKKLNLNIKNEKGYNFENIDKIKNALKNNQNNMLNLLKNNAIKYLDKKKILLEILNIKENNFIKLYKKKFKNNILNLFSDLINYLEDDFSLSSALFSSIPKDEIQNSINSILSNFDINKNYNGIKYIYFGFNFPGFFKYYKKVNNIIKEKYINNLEDIINFKEEILSIDELKQILFDKNKEKLSTSYKDYLLYYIFFEIEINNIKERNLAIDFLDKMIQICSIDNEKLKKDNNFQSFYIEKILLDSRNLCKNFCKIFLFLETNKEFIKNILILFNEFLEIIPKLLEKFKIILINTKRNYYPFEININYYLFKIFESFIDSIIDEGKFTYYFGENKEKYIKLLNKNLQLLLNINTKIYSLSLRNIEIFIDINNKNMNNLMEWTLKCLEEERRQIIEENNEININKFLINNLKEIKIEKNIYYSTISDFLIKQLQKNNKNEFSSIFNTFFGDIHFIKYSTQFFESIFESKLKKPDIIKLKSEEFFNENCDEYHEKIINEILPRNGNLILILLYYLQIVYENYYFNELQKENMADEENYKNILLNNSLNLVESSFNYYKENYSKGFNLKLIYRIAFIKQYFYHYSKILYKCKNGSEYQIFDPIKDKLNLERDITKPKKLLHNYILFLLYEFCNKKVNELKEFIKKYIINYLSQYATSEEIKFIEIEKELKKNFIILSEIPNIKLLKNQFNNNIEKDKYPLLNIILNDKSEIELLQKIPQINTFSNIIMNYLNYKITKEEISKISIKTEKENIMNMENYPLTNDKFNEIINNYIKDYNSLVEEKNKIEQNSYENYTLDYFIIRDGNNKNNLLEIYKNFVEKQNEFISKIEKNEIHKAYLDNIEEIYIQEAKEMDIPKLLSNEKLIKIIINSSYKEYGFDSNIYNDNIKKIIFDYEKIEKYLGENILMGIKKFKSFDKGITTIKYKGENNIDIDSDILYDFQKKYGKELLEENEIQEILNFIQNQNESNKEDLFLSLQLLMYHILSITSKEDDDILYIINNMPIESYNEIQKKQYFLIKSFFEKGSVDNGDAGDDENYDDLLEQMNNNDNSLNNYTVKKLFSIYEKFKEELEKY